MKAIIVEDEKYSVINLQKLLLQYAPEVEIIQVFESGREAIEKLPGLTFDLIFLDIQFNDDFDAFEFLKAWKWEQLQIIFVTSYNDYALKAFKYNAIDYVTKPIDKDELIKAIDKAKNRIFRKNELEKLLQTVDALRSRQLIIRGQHETLFLPANELLYLKAEKDYTTIHYLKGEKKHEILTSRNIGYWENEFNDLTFLRIHKSFMVNMQHIVSFGNRKVKLTDGTSLEISRDRKQEIELKIMAFKTQ